jgi:hypothetical protein
MDVHDIFDSPHIHIDANTYHHVANIFRIARQLQENPGYLAAIDQQIIGPLQPDSSHTGSPYCMQQSQPHHQAKPFDLSHSTVDSKHQAVVQIFSERAYPITPTTTTPSSLTLS